ncbi:MAG: ribbon-helix-helix domain-containing protein [Bacteroidota bacterium]
MHTQKVAVTIPKDLVALIDEISKNEGLSRSKYISSVLREKLESEKNRYIKEKYNQVFSDQSIQEEQLAYTHWLEGLEINEGQEW